MQSRKGVSKKYIGRMLETKFIEKTDVPLTDDQVNHNLKQLLKFHRRPRYKKRPNN